MELYFSSFFESIYALPKDYENYIDISKISILQTFARAETRMKKNIEKAKYFKNFLLDSGAFSMMSSQNHKTFDISEHTKKYAEFIKENDIKDFIELDVDGVFGIDVYKDCLHQLQDITGKNPIKVFHMWRGLDYYKELVKKEQKIAIGGIAIKFIKESDFNMFNELIEIAHKNNCKVHGLGLTSASNLRKYNFDSIDSSSWTCGARSGSFRRFNGHEVNSYKTPDSYKLDSNIYMLNSLQEWSKFSDYIVDF